MSDTLDQLLEEPRQFAQDSVKLLKRCTKPDSKEYIKICQAVAMGFFLMGFIGFFVKLIHIPINNIIVYVRLLPRLRE
ncbi:MAG: protein translocase SEC6 [Piptocephalis tieghemiana]|nr:MAG: protein translocase SEC6 [Piptocephalis tieghemiana]